MAEIKSSIQIAMERAAALGGGSQAELAQEEGRRQGKNLGRRAAGGDLTPADLQAALERLPGDQRDAARQAAVETLLGDLDEGRQAGLPALLALVEGTPAQTPARRLVSILAMAESVEEQLRQELAQELTDQLKGLGISGSAVHPNPAAHPQREARTEESLTRLEAARQEAAQALQQALGA